jgi:hypothetical protein
MVQLIQWAAWIVRLRHHAEIETVFKEVIMFSKHRLLLILFVSVSVCIISCAGSSRYMKPSQGFLTPTKEKAVVRFMRPSGFGYAINFNVWDGENVIGNSVAKSQFDYLADPGKHLFVAVAENKVFLEADLEAGKTYYVITRVYTGMWKARVAFIAVNRGSQLWDEVKEDENKLNKLEPNTEALKLWEEENKSKIKEVLAVYETKWKTAEQWPRLNPDDGR